MKISDNCETCYQIIDQSVSLIGTGVYMRKSSVNIVHVTEILELIFIRYFHEKHLLIVNYYKVEHCAKLY